MMSSGTPRDWAASSAGRRCGAASVWVAILILVLATLAFTLNPEAADRMAKPSLRNPSITISFLAAILAPAALIGWLFTAILTLATPVLWLVGLALGVAGVHVPELGYGPMLRTGLLALLGLVVLGSVPTLLAGSLRLREDRPTYRDSRLITGGTLIVMACAGGSRWSSAGRPSSTGCRQHGKRQPVAAQRGLFAAPGLGRAMPRVLRWLT